MVTTEKNHRVSGMSGNQPRQNGGNRAGIKAKEWTTCWRGSVGKVWGENKMDTSRY